MESTAYRLAVQAAYLAWEKGAEDIVVLDVRGLTEVTDYFVLVTGEVDIQLRGIAHYIEDKLREEGVKAYNVEGEKNLQWVLIDYVDVVVHLFLPMVRDFYDLESLWGEAKPVHLTFLNRRRDIDPPGTPFSLSKTNQSGLK